jgi:fumarate hydratase class I
LEIGTTAKKNLDKKCYLLKIQSMINYCKKQIKQAVIEKLTEIGYVADKQLKHTLLEAIETEESTIAQDLLTHLVENIEIAAEGNFPLCQDTGLVVFWVRLGQSVPLEIITCLDKILTDATEVAFTKNNFRQSVAIDPIKRTKSKGNCPPIIHTEFADGEMIEINIMLKGGGAENMSNMKMLKPAEGIEGIRNFVIETVKKSGGKACPPLIIGIGIGGNFETCTWLAKKALFRDMEMSNADEYWSKEENNLLEEINKLDIGPLGLGGKTTALAVHIETAPCHIASLPVAVNISCHSHRVGKVVIGRDEPQLPLAHPIWMGIIAGTGDMEIAPAIQLPMTPEIINKLIKGQKLLLSGKLITARDAAHRRMVEYLDRGEKLPWDISAYPIYYCGPTPAKDGFPIGACGPTTSARMDVYAEKLFVAGMRVMIGKGERSPAVYELIKRYGGSYLTAIGGAGALYGKCVKSCRCIAWADLSTEAVYELEVEDFPVYYSGVL